MTDEHLVEIYCKDEQEAREVYLSITEFMKGRKNLIVVKKRNEHKIIIPIATPTAVHYLIGDKL